MLRSVVRDLWLGAPGRIVLSLAGCTFCDNRGAAAVMWLRHRAGRRSRVVLTRRRNARRVFELHGVAEGVCTQGPPAAEAFFARELRG